MNYNLMEKKRNNMMKTKIATISLIITIILGATMAVLPLASAHDPPWTLDTWAFISVEPDPVGVNQPVFVTMWIDKVPPAAVGPWGPRWHNFMVEITRPDGTTETLGPFDSDSVGGAWTQYTPDQIGTYDFVFTFPGQTVENENPAPIFTPAVITTGAFINDTYRASTASTSLVVQEQPIERIYGPAPLPTEYWERPISSMNREWAPIAGNWFGLRATNFGHSGMYSNRGNFMPYSTAPNTAHVVWTKPIAFGGQIGGEFGTEDTGLYATGTAYEAKFNAVLINGILYYTEIPGAGNNQGALKAVDLRTGEEIWSKPRRDHHTLRCGMVYNFITGNQYGGHAYLFTTNSDFLGFVANTEELPIWSMYDAMTGEWILDIANQSASTLTTGPNGELLSYSTSGGMLSLWNLSRCVEEGSWDQVVRVYSPYEMWRPPQGGTIDWNGGIEWSIPVAAPGAINCVTDDVVVTTYDLGGPYGVPGGAQTGWRVDTGYDANTGAIKWGPINRTLTPWVSLSLYGNSGEGIYTEYNRNELTITAYDLKTGQKRWGPTAPEDNIWGYYDFVHGIVIGYGKAYSFGMGGAVYCYDVETGDRLWKWDAGDAGLDTPYGIWPLGTWGTHHILADGKLYIRGGHDYTPPVWKGAELYCIDAETGEEIWSSLNFGIVGSPALHDGYMLWFNGYDNQIYCYNKGPSKTSVGANPGSITEGSSIIITGMVTDVSAGTKSSLLTSRFPNGVPAISDTSQSEWMEYLYQQQQMPMDAVGVDVTIDVIDANGNFRNIGTATSDASGFYSLEWMPDIPGKYTVIATFAGSEAYYASYAETAFVVDQAPEPTPPPDSTPAPMTDTYIAGSTVAILAGIAIAVFLILRKK
jgi:outer membrane protein assembly factor BamB